MELVARHNISSGPKGKRRTIMAGQRFNPADYPDVTKAEWDTMIQNGNVLPPSEPDYASPAGMRTVAREEKKPPAPRRGKAREEDDEDDDV